MLSFLRDFSEPSINFPQPPPSALGPFTERLTGSGLRLGAALWEVLSRPSVASIYTP